MPKKKITLRILRYKPGHIDPPRYQEFPLAADPEMRVLDALEAIRLRQDSTLMYRHSCHHSSCGTCACKINGRERLTCTTKIKEFKGNTVTLTPLDGFKPIGDLVVDISPFYNDFSENWSCLKKSEYGQTAKLPEDINEFERFENCIECAACISACPVTARNEGFIGPAVLAAVSNELRKSPPESEGLFEIAGNEYGEHLCERALNCSRMCPTGVYPAGHIANLRKLLAVEILEADLGRPQHQRTVVALLDAYAMDPMGNGKALSNEVRRDLIPGLQQHPTTIIFLAFQNQKAVGIATCFRGFSTFAARPLINISDFYVLPELSGQNIGKLLLKAVENKARDTGCCKVTLEVQENNHRAQRIYEAAGFSRTVYMQAAGGALFYSKPL